MTRVKLRERESVYLSPMRSRGSENSEFKLDTKARIDSDETTIRARCCAHVGNRDEEAFLIAFHRAAIDPL